MGIHRAGNLVRYAYLHGFGSSPLASKGVHLNQWFRDELNLSLDLPDLNVPSFRQQTLSKIVDHVEKRIVTSHSVWSLIGSSFGGLVSTLVAQRQPSLIQSIVLLAPAFNATRLWSSQMSVEQWRNAGFLNHFNPTSQREEPVDYTFFQDLQSHQAFPLVLSCPVTIVHGLHDAVVPIGTSRDYYQQLRAANKHPTALVEVDDDHHLRKEATLHTIQSILLRNHRSIVL